MFGFLALLWRCGFYKVAAILRSLVGIHLPGNKMKKKLKPWDGRFEEATDAFVESFTASVTFDKELARYDIEGSIAHATMLRDVGILEDGEAHSIVIGLRQIQEQILKGEFNWSISLEDVHMNIERELTELIGETGKKLHTGRSRNDQVATDMRLYLRNAIDKIREKIFEVQIGILDLAEREADTIMPGLTHLQIAQPITFGHHLMAWFEMICRDCERFEDCRKRVNTSPLGAAALGGTSYPIDRELTAKLLGFDKVCNNSMDAVSDRDFAIEFTGTASILMVHLSRWAEELVLWASPHFDFIDLPDRFCTGSSIMPQKKNPDVAELVRGKSGRVVGSLMTLLALMKAQPLAYNKDNQEDKEPLFDSVKTILSCLTAFADMIPAIQAKRDNMFESALNGYSTATDLADYLVKKGLAFRDAHEVVGKIVKIAIEQDLNLEQLNIEELKKHNKLIGEDLDLSLEGSVNARQHIGGTAPKTVIAAISAARAKISAVSQSSSPTTPS